MTAADLVVVDLERQPWSRASAGPRPIRRPTWRSTARSTASAGSSTPTPPGPPPGPRPDARSRCSAPPTPISAGTRSRSPAPLTEAEVHDDYESCHRRRPDRGRRRPRAASCPACWSAATRPSAWGRDPAAAVEQRGHARGGGPDGPADPAARARGAGRWPDALRAKHYERKHGPGAYYGQSLTARPRGRHHRSWSSVADGRPGAAASLRCPILHGRPPAPSPPYVVAGLGRRGRAGADDLHALAGSEAVLVLDAGYEPAQPGPGRGRLRRRGITVWLGDPPLLRGPLAARR